MDLAKYFLEVINHIYGELSDGILDDNYALILVAC
jgi:hypothetical protein